MSLIKPQIKKPGLEELESAISKMRQIAYDYHRGNIDQETYEIDMEEALKDVADAIKNRFGFKVRISSMRNNYAIFPLTKDWVFDNSSLIKKFREFSEKKEYKNLLKNIKKFKKWLKENAVVIDRENARIIKFPSDITVTMLMDFTFVNFKLSVKEVVAVLLHEIGHFFTLLEMFSVTHHTTLRLLDDFISRNLDDLREMGITLTKDPKNLSYEEKKNIIIRTVEVLDKKASIPLAKIGIDKTNMEYEADAFATYFGYGGELVTALDKLMDVGGMTMTSILFFNFILLIKFLVTNLIAVAMFLFTGSLSLALAVGLFLYGLRLIAKILVFMILTTHSRVPEADEHGNVLIRIKNIKYRVISVIRTSESLDKKTKLKLIETIQQVEKELEDIEKSGYVTFLSANIKFAFAPNFSVEEELAGIVDEIINNDFYYLRTKLEVAVENIELNKLLLKDFIDTDIKVSTEDIHYQGYKDPIVNELIEFYTKVTENSVFKNTAEYLELAEELSHVIKKRFGLKVLIVPGIAVGSGFGVLPFNILDQHAFKDWKNLMKLPLPINPINFMLTYLKYESDKKMLHKIINSNIVVDYENAKIKGVSDYWNIMFIEFGRGKTYLTHKHDPTALTPEELAAVTLHEIGHLFTYIDNIKRTVVNNTMLLESFSNRYGKTDKININNENSKVAAIETLKSLTGFTNLIKTLFMELLALIGIGMDSQMIGMGGIAAKTISSIVTRNDRIGSIDMSMTDSETAADDFAVKFGLGPQLASGLDRMLTLGKIRSPLTPLIFVSLNIFLASLLITIYNGGGFSFPAFLSALIGIMGMMAVFFIIRAYIGEYFSYEKLPKRIEKMKRDLVRVIREEKNLSIEKKNEILDAIDAIEKTVKGVLQSGYGSVIWQMLLPTQNVGTEFKPDRILVNMLDDLINNDLYVFNLRLDRLYDKLLKGK